MIRHKDVIKMVRLGLNVARREHGTLNADRTVNTLPDLGIGIGVLTDTILRVLNDCGLVIVPREPTEEMQLNGLAFAKSLGPMIPNIWSAMIAEWEKENDPGS